MLTAAAIAYAATVTAARRRRSQPPAWQREREVEDQRERERRDHGAQAAQQRRSVHPIPSQSAPNQATPASIASRPSRRVRGCVQGEPTGHDQAEARPDVGDPSGGKRGCVGRRRVGAGVDGEDRGDRPRERRRRCERGQSRSEGEAPVRHPPILAPKDCCQPQSFEERILWPAAMREPPGDPTVVSCPVERSEIDEGDSERVTSARLAAALLGAVGAGCSVGDDDGGDKAGGSSAPTVLRLAAADDADQPDARFVRRFASQVAKLSGGSVRVRVVWDAAGQESAGYEAQIAQLVRDGEFALGWMGARAWDRLGVTSFQALQAPFLVTDHALLGRVAAGPLGAQMLAGLDREDFVGLALVPDRLRYPSARGTRSRRRTTSRGRVCACSPRARATR